MTALVTKHLPLVAGAPDGIKKLRALILDLAIRGKLVPQDPADTPAMELLVAAGEARAQKKNARKASSELDRSSVDGAQLAALPKAWVWTTLADVAQINPRNSLEDNVTVSFVPMAMIGTRFDSGHEHELRPWGEVKQGFTHFAEGDIGVAKITPCFENSKACVFSGLSNGFGAGTTELHVVRPLAKTLAPRYVLAYLKSPWFLSIGETKMTGTAGQKRLPKDFVERHPFPLPPLAEQHRIVAKVDELMALCDRLEADQADAEAAHAQLVQALLDSLTQATDAADFRASWQRLSEHFHTLFTTEASMDALKRTVLQLAVMGKLVPQDFADESPSILLERIANEVAIETLSTGSKKSRTCAEVEPAERYVDTPSSWIWTRLGSQVLGSGAGWSPSCEARPRVNDEWGVLKVSAVSWGEFRPEENKALPVNLEARPEHEVQAGDFLVSRANTAELVARSVVVESPPPRLMLSDKIVRFRLTTHCNRRYVNLVNSSPFARSYYGVMAGGTSSSMKNVTREQILNLPLPLPPLVEQHRIVAKVDELMALCDQLKAQLSAARQQHAQLATVLVEQAVA